MGPLWDDRVVGEYYYASGKIVLVYLLIGSVMWRRQYLSPRSRACLCIVCQWITIYC